MKVKYKYSYVEGLEICFDEILIIEFDGVLL